MLTLTSALIRTARLYGDRPAILGPECRYTWSEFADRVARAAAVLMSLNIEPRERYAIICRNDFRNAELMHAGYWLGAVPVPINYRLAPPEIAYILDNADAGLLIVEDAFAGLLEEAELARWTKSVLLVGAGGTSGTVQNYEVLLEKASPRRASESTATDEALLLYTGGTTGRPKGVPLSHLNIVSNALQLGFELGPRSDDVYLHVAPMFHSADLLATCYGIAGSAHVFLPKFSPKAVLAAIRDYGVTVTMMTPTMLILTMQDPDIDDFDLSTLRQVIYGSSPMAVEWITRMLERFKGVELVQGYGLTETSPILTLLPMADHEAAVASGDHQILASAGRPIPAVEMRIVDDDGKDVETGKSGEVVVEGPNVSTGYLKRPEDTRAAFRDGWFFTGDIGRVDERGYLYVLDRKKDMIITGGENVFSSEVEAILYQHPKVHECAVIGVPDETYGEALLAAVVAAPGTKLAAEDLIAHCRGKIGGYKIPRRYVFLEELPKSAMDKILKTELRRRYGGGAR